MFGRSSGSIRTFGQRLRSEIDPPVEGTLESRLNQFQNFHPKKLSSQSPRNVRCKDAVSGLCRRLPKPILSQTTRLRKRATAPRRIGVAYQLRHATCDSEWHVDELERGLLRFSAPGAASAAKDYTAIVLGRTVVRTCRLGHRLLRLLPSAPSRAGRRSSCWP
jgi:hypothetical protein